MTLTAVVLRHETHVHLGNLEPLLHDYGFAVRYVETTSDDLDAIDAIAPDLLVVLGGDMGVYDTDEHPWLTAEVALLRRRLTAERPTLGVCLGAQLMANALGAAVHPGPTTEIGFHDVEPTTAGCASPLRHVAGVPVMQWHGDTFELPAGVTRLAGSAAYENQAFGIDAWALAVQFHPELTEAMHENWLSQSTDELAASHIDIDDLRAERTRHSAAMQQASRRMFSDWLDELGFQKSR